MSKRFKNIITIFSFVSILLIPIGIALMWFLTTWKKKIKVIISIVSAALYIALLVLFFMLEPSYNTSGTSLPLNYDKGYTAFDSEHASTKKTTQKKDSDKKSGTIDLDSIVDTPQKSQKIPRTLTKRSGGEASRWILVFMFIILLIILIIIRNVRGNKKSKYENPYVDTNLYKLPLADDAKMPMVHFLRLQPKAGERILFATETTQKGNEGNFVVTNQRVAIMNLEETTEFPLEVLEAVSSVSNSVMLLTSGTRKYYIFMDESQLSYALAVVRWAYKNKTTSNSN